MEVIYYTTTDELRRILATRTDPAAAAVVLLPRGWAWLLVEKKFIKNDKHSQATGMTAEKR